MTSFHRFRPLFRKPMIAALAAAAVATAVPVVVSSIDSQAATPATPATPAGHRVAGHDRSTPSGLPRGGLSAEAAARVREYPQALASARFYRGIETGDITDEDRSLSRDWVDVPLADGQGPGRAGFASVLQTYHRAFPDLRVHIDEIAVAGDTITSRNTLTGHQMGPFLGVPATGRLVTLRTTDVHHYARGLIRNSYHLEDLFGAYQQVTAER